METKFKIIETPEYILAVSDEKISRGDCNITNGRDIFDYSDVKEYSLEYANRYWQKIITYQPKGYAKELDLPLLPEIVVEDDVEKLALASWESDKFNEELFPKGKEVYCAGFWEGYKAATKFYSEEDLRKAIMEAYLVGVERSNYGKQLEDDIIQSIKKSKIPKWFIAEIEEWLDQTYSEHGCYRQRLKTTTINDKVYLVGKYEN
jgi:hypothetical protein